jgi:hypothetical protein
MTRRPEPFARITDAHRAAIANLTSVTALLPAQPRREKLLALDIAMGLERGAVICVELHRAAGAPDWRVRGSTDRRREDQVRVAGVAGNVPGRDADYHVDAFASRVTDCRHRAMTRRCHESLNLTIPRSER